MCLNNLPGRKQIRKEERKAKKEMRQNCCFVTIIIVCECNYVLFLAKPQYTVYTTV